MALFSRPARPRATPLRRSSRLDTAGDQHTKRYETFQLARHADFAEDALGICSRHRRRPLRRHGSPGQAYSRAGRGDHTLILVKPRQAQTLADYNRIFHQVLEAQDDSLRRDARL
jgi:hypothetical protein